MRREEVELPNGNRIPEYYIFEYPEWINVIAITKERVKNEGPFHFTPEQRKAYTSVGGAPHLDGDYTVFGEVIEGLNVVAKIEQVETGAADRPVEDVKVIKMQLVK